VATPLLKGANDNGYEALALMISLATLIVAFIAVGKEKSNLPCKA
jgi:hypothetical protein